MFRKGFFFGNICPNHLIPLILLNRAILKKTNKKQQQQKRASRILQRTGRKNSRLQLSQILSYANPKFGQTDRHIDINYEIPNSTPSVENIYTVWYKMHQILTKEAGFIGFIPREILLSQQTPTSTEVVIAHGYAARTFQVTHSHTIFFTFRCYFHVHFAIAIDFIVELALR